MKITVRFAGALGMLVFATAGFAQTNTFPASGNVGIGTTSPGLTLDVSGPIRSTSSGGVDLRLQAGAAGAAGLGSFSNHPVLFFTVGTEKVRIDTDGNVGIGTMFPSGLGKLAVVGSIVTASPDVGHSASLTMDNTGHGALTAYYGTGAYLGFNTTSASGVVGEQMRITSAGNIGIGTTNPTQKLSVNGTIQAKEVIVQTGWSDYVFDEGYRLAPLSEVEQRIKADKHLPGIPSAQEVAEHGVSMGDMQSKLLAKIEELTLHQIAQEKQLAAQAARIAQLERANAALRNP